MMDFYIRSYRLVIISPRTGQNERTKPSGPLVVAKGMTVLISAIHWHGFLTTTHLTGSTEEIEILRNYTAPVEYSPLIA